MLANKSAVRSKVAKVVRRSAKTVALVEQNFHCADPAARYAVRDSGGSGEYAKFAGLLAQKKLQSDFDIAKLVHNRLSLTVIDRLLEEGVTKREINLIAPTRTLAHRRANAEKLTVEESDRAVRLARVIAQAESVFDDKEQALAWLRRPMKRFENHSPIAMLISDVGSRLVEEALVQIDEGFFA